jgi:hypothetical protein
VEHPDTEGRAPAVVHEGLVGRLGVLVVVVAGTPMVTVMPLGHGDVLRDRDRQGPILLRVSMDRLEIVRLAPTPPADLPERALDAAEDQHPPAPHPELPPVTHQRGEHVHAEQDERDADDAFHHGVDAVGKLGSKDDRQDPDREHDEGMAERVDRAVLERQSAVLLRAGDVRDRGDVVPVDAVPEPEQERRHDDADAKGLRGSEQRPAIPPRKSEDIMKAR